MNLFSDTAGDLAAVGNSILVVSSSGAGTNTSIPYNRALAVNVAPPQIAVSGNVYLLDANGNPTNPTAPARFKSGCTAPTRARAACRRCNAT